MTCFIELLKCIICCEKEHLGDSYQAAHENRSYTRIPTSSTLSKEEEDANNWNPVLFNASAVLGSSSVNNSLPVKPPDVTPEPILLPPVPIPLIDPLLPEGIINKSLTPIDQMLPSSSEITPPLTVSLPVKPPDVTLAPEPIGPILLPSVPIPSIDPLLPGGIINRSLTPIDPMFPSSSGIPSPPSPLHLSNPPKETNYVWDENGTTTHEVPEDYFKTLIKKGITPGVLKKPLSPLTYRDYFAALLYAEEYYMEKWSEYILSNVTLELHKMGDKYFVAFEIGPGRRQFFLPNDQVLVKPAGRNAQLFKGRFYRVVNGNLALAKFGVDFFSTYSPELKYDVSFEFGGACLKRYQQAVETAMDPLFQVFLFPNQTSRARDLNPSYLMPCYQNVDYVQALAIYRISMIKNPPPYLIEGPLCLNYDKKLSRTGLVIQQAVLRIRELSPGCRILINAPTNKTCDVLLRSLMEEIPESDMFRANAAFRVINGVSCDILTLCTLQGGCFTCPSLQQLKSFKVIVSTYVSSFRLHMEGITGGHFSHIFLVDASLAIEPELMISLANLAGPETVVVVSGCSTKSPTRIRSSIARWNGLGLSYFERLFGSEPYCSRDPTFVTCIDEII